MPIERFDTENYRPEQYALLEYLIAVADKVAPDVAHDADGNMYAADSQAPHIFMRRYNNQALNVSFTYDEYIRRAKYEENIIDMVDSLGIDRDKFWYLLMFVTDYVVGSTTDTLKLKYSPKEEIERFVEFVERNCSGFSRLSGFTFDRPMTLSLHIKGRKLEIDNPNTIAMIASLCKESLTDINPHSILNIIELEKGYTKSGSVKVWLFAQLLKCFFEQYPQFRGQKKDKGSISKSTLLLISKLAYFAGFTTKEDYNSSDEIIKAILKQYRGLELDTVNRIYG